MPVGRPKLFLADKGYDGDYLREELLIHGIKPVIPPKANRKNPPPCDFRAYKDRNRIERMFNRLKQFRRVATRYTRPGNPSQHSLRWPRRRYGCHTLSTGPNRRPGRVNLLEHRTKYMLCPNDPFSIATTDFLVRSWLTKGGIRLSADDSVPGKPFPHSKPAGIPDPAQGRDRWHEHVLAAAQAIEGGDAIDTPPDWICG